jgi:hypothetical protein
MCTFSDNQYYFRVLFIEIINEFQTILRVNSDYNSKLH